MRNNKNSVYSLIKKFKAKYPLTIAWRIKAHSRVVERYLNPGEDVIYAFAGQKGPSWYEIFFSCVVVLTNKRILVATKRFWFGHFFLAITPDMFNDLDIKTGMIWSKIYIDTIKEVLELSNIDIRATDEIETAISEQMMKEKKKYGRRAVAAGQ